MAILILSTFCRGFICLLGRLVGGEAVVESIVALFEARVLRQRALNRDELGLLAQLVQEAHLALCLLVRLTLRRVQRDLALTLVHGHREKFGAELRQSLLLCVGSLGPRGLVYVVNLDATGHEIDLVDDLVGLLLT